MEGKIPNDGAFSHESVSVSCSLGNALLIRGGCKLWDEFHYVVSPNILFLSSLRKLRKIKEEGFPGKLRLA